MFTPNRDCTVRIRIKRLLFYEQIEHPFNYYLNNSFTLKEKYPNRTIDTDHHACQTKLIYARGLPSTPSTNLPQYTDFVTSPTVNLCHASFVFLRQGGRSAPPLLAHLISSTYKEYYEDK